MHDHCAIDNRRTKAAMSIFHGGVTMHGSFRANAESCGSSRRCSEGRYEIRALEERSASDFCLWRLRNASSSDDANRALVVRSVIQATVTWAHQSTWNETAAVHSGSTKIMIGVSNVRSTKTRNEDLTGNAMFFLVNERFPTPAMRLRRVTTNLHLQTTVLMQGTGDGKRTFVFQVPNHGPPCGSSMQTEPLFRSCALVGYALLIRP